MTEEKFRAELRALVRDALLAGISPADIKYEVAVAMLRLSEVSYARERHAEIIAKGGHPSEHCERQCNPDRIITP